MTWAWLAPWFPTAEKNPDSWLMLLSSLSVKLFPLTTVEMLLVRLLCRLLLLDLEDVVGCETTRLTLVGLDPPLAELGPEVTRRERVRASKSQQTNLTSQGQKKDCRLGGGN